MRSVLESFDDKLFLVGRQSRFEVESRLSQSPNPLSRLVIPNHLKTVNYRQTAGVGHDAVSRNRERALETCIGLAALISYRNGLAA
jgi:hypothetical protein